MEKIKAFDGVKIKGLRSADYADYAELKKKNIRHGFKKMRDERT